MLVCKYILQVTLENNLVVSQKDKNKTSIWPRNSTYRYVSKGNENICPYKETYVNIHSIIIHNSPN